MKFRQEPRPHRVPGRHLPGHPDQSLPIRDGKGGSRRRLHIE
jgi:hypothetical protein